MDVKPVLELLEGLGLDFRQYAGAEELSDIQDYLKILPAAFVIPAAQQAATNSHSVGVIDQLITQRFTVLAVLRKPRSGDLHRIESKVMDGLIGWSSGDMFNRPASPVEFAGQRTFNLGGNLATSLDFITTYHFRK